MHEYIVCISFSLFSLQFLLCFHHHHPKFMTFSPITIFVAYVCINSSVSGALMFMYLGLRNIKRVCPLRKLTLPPSASHC